MAKLKIITGADNPILRKRSVEVKKFDARLKKFAKDLRAKMVEADGLGLAAPQVSENIRVVVVTLNHGKSNAVAVTMVNPVIMWHSEEMVVREEGCLSLPGQYGKVERWKELHVEFRDVEGERHVLKLAELDARVMQHEVDHIDGVLFVDRLGEKEKTEDLLM